MNNEVKNPFVWVEIYVEDIDRAQKFYETVFQIKMTPMENPGDFGDLKMVSFPSSMESIGISGALCQTSLMKPSANGTIVYFTCDDCAIQSARITQAGGKIHQEKFSIGQHGFCCLFADTEGNTIGLHSLK